jgi:hypothetical protein
MLAGWKHCPIFKNSPFIVRNLTVWMTGWGDWISGRNRTAARIGVSPFGCHELIFFSGSIYSHPTFQPSTNPSAIGTIAVIVTKMAIYCESDEILPIFGGSIIFKISSKKL